MLYCPESYMVDANGMHVCGELLNHALNMQMFCSCLPVVDLEGGKCPKH